jgi:arylsulfatase
LLVLLRTDNDTSTSQQGLARQKYFVEGTEPLPEGKVTLVYDFAYDGSGPHKGGTGTLSINSKKVGVIPPREQKTPRLRRRRL